MPLWTPHCSALASSTVSTLVPAIDQHALVGLEVGLGEVDDLLALVGDRHLRQGHVEVAHLPGDELVEADVDDLEVAHSQPLLQGLGDLVLVATGDGGRVVAVPEARCGQAGDHRERVIGDRREVGGSA